jgi:hypothetical protein
MEFVIVDYSRMIVDNAMDMIILMKMDYYQMVHVTAVVLSLIALDFAEVHW